MEHDISRAVDHRMKYGETFKELLLASALQYYKGKYTIEGTPTLELE